MQTLNHSFAATSIVPGTDDFRAYLEKSLRDPFTLNLKDYSLLAVINACVKAKSRLMRDIGFTEEVRIEERHEGRMTATSVPKWKLISSHTARRTAITIAVLRGHNVHAIKRCSGHSDLRSFEQYVRDE